MKDKYMISIFVFVISFELFVISAIVLKVFGLWVPMLLLGILSLASLISILIMHYNYVKYICPICDITFKGRRLQRVFSLHYFGKRKMFCPICREKRWCKETIEEND